MDRQPGSLVNVGCNSFVGLTSVVQVAVTAGTAYYIEIVADSPADQSPSLTLNADLVLPPATMISTRRM